jgi:hypothetical protein
LFFSMISWTSRTSVRSISEADINCAFSFRLAGRVEGRGVMNAESYAGKALRGKVETHSAYIRSFLRIMAAPTAPPRVERIRNATSTNASEKPIIKASPGGVFRYSKAF